MSDEEFFTRMAARYRDQYARWDAARQSCRTVTNPDGSGRSVADCRRLVGGTPLSPHFSSGMADTGRSSGAAEPRVVDVELLAQRAVARLRLPTVTPKVGPPPAVNPWGIAVVGYPLWLWTTGASTVTTSTSLDGVTLTLTAKRVRTRFDMGEPGGSPVVCTATTAWTATVGPAVESPTCGYTYQRASITQTAPEGTYTVTATEQWTVTWSALGRTGEIPLQTAGSIRLTVGEVQAVRRP